MRRWLFILALLPALGATALQADTDGLPLWELGIGIGGMRFPDYRGAEQSQSYLLPIPTVVYRGERLKLDDKGLRGLLFDSERLILDISLDGAVPVDSSQNGAREGMPDLDAAFEIGPSLKWILHDQRPLEIRLNLPLRQVISSDFSRFDNRGQLFHPHLSLDHRRLWNLGLSFGPLYASRAYHDYYYSVDPAYATPERPAYQAQAGYSGLRYTATLSRRFARIWVGAFLRYDDLRGVVFEDSPLLRENQAWMGGASAVWFFHQSKERVRRESTH